MNSFAGCTNLRVIHIPDTVELISLGTEGTAFLNCTSLRTIDIYETGNAVEPVYTSVGGVLFSVDD